MRAGRRAGTMASHLQVSQENSVVRDTFSRRCGAVLARKEKGEFFDVKVAEFDGAYYNIKAEKKTPALVALSVALPDAVNMPQVSYLLLEHCELRASRA